MSAPLVSVVIPAYNHERFIGAAIDSVLQQSLGDLELIIVDDGSTDRTAEVIRGYTDRRMSYTWQENQDAFNTINRGMGMARGKYIAILNSDDVYTPDRLEKLVARADDSALQVLFTDVIPISDDGEEFTDADFGWNVWHAGNRDFYRAAGDVYTAFLHGNYMVTTSNLFMTRSIVEEVGGFAPIRYLHDYDYIFRLMLAAPDGVAYVDDEKLLYYRIHSGNTLSEAAITGREQDLEVIEKYMLARLPEAYRPTVKAGSDRLRALENEIHDVRRQLAGEDATPGAGRSLPRRIAARIRRTLSA